tara:strand:- start:255 stop:650 length:396 start_codon:yes stop_codon:yes gene_type:complete
LKASEAVMIGFGQNSCEEFNSDVRESNQWAHHYFSWAAGYMSAINVRNQERFGEAIDLWPASFDGPKQMEFLKNYCSLNPDKMFALGVMTLFNALTKEWFEKAEYQNYRQYLGLLFSYIELGMFCSNLRQT